MLANLGMMDMLVRNLDGLFGRTSEVEGERSYLAGTYSAPPREGIGCLYDRPPGRTCIRDILARAASSFHTHRYGCRQFDRRWLTASFSKRSWPRLDLTIVRSFDILLVGRGRLKHIQQSSISI